MPDLFAVFEKIADNNDEALEKLDAEFYKYPDDIRGLLAKFRAEHGG